MQIEMARVEKMCFIFEVIGNDDDYIAFDETKYFDCIYGYQSEVPLSRGDDGAEVAMEYVVPMEADRTIGMESLDYLESSIEGLVVIVAYAVGHVLGIPDPSGTEQPLSWQ